MFNSLRLRWTFWTALSLTLFFTQPHPVSAATPTSDRTSTGKATSQMIVTQFPAPMVAVPKSDRDDVLFPRYEILKPNIAFWTRVFAEFSEYQSVVHAADYPDVVFKVLDFRDKAAYLGEDALRKQRSQEETKAREQIVAVLEQVHAARRAPESLKGESRRIYELLSRIEDDGKFIKAAGAVRVQRGLKERTRSALATSGKYLPAMESVFRSHNLPVRLTRLPLVESSFDVEAYSKVGAAGLWQFMPSSARIYMRLDDIVDDRRDPWTSTEGAARHLRDDYARLGSWPLALTAYNHGRGGIAKGLRETDATDLPDLIRLYRAKTFGFASRNFYAEFLAAYDIERNWRKHFGEIELKTPLEFEVVETKHYVPYDTLRRLCEADDALFHKLNPAYRPEVIEGRLYVPPGHLIRVPAGTAKGFQIAYASLGAHERFDQQKVYHLLHKVQRGETLSGLAKRYNVALSSIATDNGLAKSAKLREGEVLKITPRQEQRPGSVIAIAKSKPQIASAEKSASYTKESSSAPNLFRVHRVRQGQTLSSIAKLHRVSIADLRAANDLGTSSDIREGAKLRVPSGR